MEDIKMLKLRNKTDKTVRFPDQPALKPKEERDMPEHYASNPNMEIVGKPAEAKASPTQPSKAVKK